jgi:hypothetical protein
MYECLKIVKMGNFIQNILLHIKLKSNFFFI